MMLAVTLSALFLTSSLLTVGDYAPLYHGHLEVPDIRGQWASHPYWGDDSFHKGDISFDGILYSNVSIKYNIRDNQIILLTPTSKLSVVPEQKKIDYFIMDGKKYLPDGNGWFSRVEYDGECVSLLHGMIKVVSGSIEHEKHFLKALVPVEITYLRFENDSCVYVDGKKSLLKASSMYKESVKKFCEGRSLRFSKKNRINSLTECTHFLDSLLSLSRKTNDSNLQEYITKNNATYVPDSIFQNVIINTSLDAYHAYLANDDIGYAFESDINENKKPGIGTFEPIKEDHVIKEVEVVALKRKMQAIRGGMESFRPALMKNIPMSLGEADILKIATMLPGVNSTGEVSSGLNVRGGGSDQNLMLYNANTVFNPMHMFGLLSTFNLDMIAESEIYKGDISSQYGGRLSSVVKMKSRFADKTKIHGSASLGLLTTKLLFETPIQKEKSSLMFGARTTYSDWMLGLLSEKSGYKNGKAGFYDLSATYTTTVMHNNRLDIFGYYSSDRFSFVQEDKYYYNNLNISAVLRSNHSEENAWQLEAGMDYYGYRNDHHESDESAGRLHYGITQWFTRWNCSHQLNEKHSFLYGAEAIFHDVMPGSYTPLGAASLIKNHQLRDRTSAELSVFAEDDWKITDAINITIGGRMEGFASFRQDHQKVYLKPDIRFSLLYRVNENKSVRLGIGSMHQYIHKVSNTVIMSPTDSWILSDSAIKPQNCLQLTGGYYVQTNDGAIEVSAEAYYKSMNNCLTYSNAAQLTMNEELEKAVTPTQGRAYGVELQVRRLTGRLTGWFSYSYSRSLLRQRGVKESVALNRGEWFPTDYDCPHEFKVVGNYKFTQRYSLSVNADMHTGRAFTAPVGQFYDDTQGRVIPVYSERNNCRMPDYLRMDASFNIEPTHHQTVLLKQWISFGAYNIFGRQNVYSIYHVSEGNQIKAYQLSIFGAPIPYISYNVKF